MRIRAAHREEFSVLQDIELAAGAAFRDVGMPEVADDEPFTDEELGRYTDARRAWVAVDEADVPVAYPVAEPVDDNLHVEQVSVHPRCARRGIGRALLDHVAQVARTEHAPALTLTTFTEVPWNAPYYARCGFHPTTDGMTGPELRAIREHEAALGLDRWPRICMRRPL